MKNAFKKVLSIALVIVMVFAMTACGDKNTELKFATGGSSGTYYGFCGIIANIIGEKLQDTTITIESTGASKTNMQLLEAGENQIAIVQNDVMTYAYTATDLFSGSKPYTDFSAVMTCYPETVQIIAQKGITSIDQLKGKRISVGDAGSGTEFNAKQVLAAYGIDFADINVNNVDFGGSVDEIKAGNIDAAFVVAGAPTVAITQLAADYSNFNILNVDAAHAAKLMNEYPFYTTITIPAGTYKGIDYDVETVSVMATIVARNDVSEDVIYNFVKAVFDNKAEIAANHDKGKLIDAKTAVSGLGEVPLHKGAQKYYKEIGAL